MITETTKIAGIEVTLGYCFATELNYRNLADEEIADYFKKAFGCIQEGKDPDTDKSIRLVLASIISYYDSIHTDSGKATYPIDERTLIYDTAPDELMKAVITIVNLRNKFYKIPEGEPKDKEPKPGRKKGKN